MPYLTWTNVFHFTASGDNSNDGDRIPALFIKNQNQIGYFQICNGIKNVAIYHEIYIGKVYQFIINHSTHSLHKVAIFNEKRSQKLFSRKFVKLFV